MNRVLLLILLTATVLFTGCQSTPAGDPYGLADELHASFIPADRASEDGWMLRHEQVLERVAQGNIDLLMVGDMIPGGTTLNPQWAKTDAASLLASGIADNKMVFYLDINQVFLDDNGTLTREVRPDLLHLSEKSYAIWAGAMEPTIRRLLAEGGGPGPATKSQEACI